LVGSEKLKGVNAVTGLQGGGFSGSSPYAATEFARVNSEAKITIRTAGRTLRLGIEPPFLGVGTCQPVDDFWASLPMLGACGLTVKYISVGIT
jgi:hypothetical protein